MAEIELRDVALFGVDNNQQEIKKLLANKPA